MLCVKLIAIDRFRYVLAVNWWIRAPWSCGCGSCDPVDADNVILWMRNMWSCGCGTWDPVDADNVILWMRNMWSCGCGTWDPVDAEHGILWIRIMCSIPDHGNYDSTPHEHYDRKHDDGMHHACRITARIMIVCMILIARTMIARRVHARNHEARS